MLTLKKFNGTIPIGEAILASSATELANLHTDTILAGGYIVFDNVEAPECNDILSEYVEGTPTDLKNGTWTRTWVLQDKAFASNDELILAQAVDNDNKWAKLRNLRNYEIGRTDWMAGSDITMADDVKNYRQALRDITNGLTNPEDAVWPENPLNLP